MAAELARHRADVAAVREPPSPVAALRACNWLDADEPGLARVRNLSSSHSVHVATRGDGAQAIIKRAQESSKRGLHQELFVYRLASWIPELGRVLPRALHIDEGMQLLVLEALPALPRTLPLRTDPEFYRRSGKCLAKVHRSTFGLAMLPSLASGILDLPRQPEAAAEGRPEQTASLMHRIASDSLLSDALLEAKAQYRSLCLIHGDLRPDHWIELDDGSLRLIDWEMGGGGDPGLDIAAALVEPFLDRLRSGDYAADWIEGARMLIRALVEGYSAEGPLNLLEHQERAHVVRLAAARLLHVACEWADTGQLTKPVDAAFDQAKILLGSRSSLAELLIP